MIIYVSNLSDKITDESLRAVFATYGEVTSSRVIKDRFTGYSRGFAFIEMPDNTEAENAILKVNDAVLDKRQVNVEKARAEK